MVTKGDILHSVFFLHSGSAQAVTRDDKGQETLVALYNATDQDVAMLPSHVARGCIIGGTALVDGTLAGWPDANTATCLACKCSPQRGVPLSQVRLQAGLTRTR